MGTVKNNYKRLTTLRGGPRHGERLMLKRDSKIQNYVTISSKQGRSIYLFDSKILEICRILEPLCLSPIQDWWKPLKPSQK